MNRTPSPHFAPSADSPAALLKQLMFQLIIHAARWTPELRELQAKVELLLAHIEKVPANGSVASAASHELWAKANRYDRLRELAEATSTEHAGFLVGSRLYPTFDAAFDAEMTTFENEHSPLR